MEKFLFCILEAVYPARLVDYTRALRLGHLCEGSNPPGWVLSVPKLSEKAHQDHSQLTYQTCMAIETFQTYIFLMTANAPERFSAATFQYRTLPIIV